MGCLREVLAMQSLRSDGGPKTDGDTERLADPVGDWAHCDRGATDTSNTCYRRAR